MSSSLEIILIARPTSWREPAYFRSACICSDARCSVTRLCARYLMMSLSVSFSSRRSWLCDRRVTNAELTPAGRTLTERALAVYSAGLRELVLQRLGLNGLRTLADHMSRLGCDVLPED